jgi:hypothetical protein
MINIGGLEEVYHGNCLCPISPFHFHLLHCSRLLSWNPLGCGFGGPSPSLLLFVDVLLLVKYCNMDNVQARAIGDFVVGRRVVVAAVDDDSWLGQQRDPYEQKQKVMEESAVDHHLGEEEELKKMKNFWTAN